MHAETDSWVATSLPANTASIDDQLFDPILERRDITRDLGQQTIWSGYSTAGLVDYPLDTAMDATRTPEQVAIGHGTGRFFTQVVLARKADLILEIGSAFGVSGMYWLAGLENNGVGHLLAFEPNTAWADVARENLAAIGSRFELVNGTFEDGVASVDAFGATIDIAFIDAIHTSEIVRRQLELVTARSSPGALVFLDDIDFSADMSALWNAIKLSPDYAAAAQIGRVGLIELHR